ncbi:MAG: ABC transporter permease [Clostridia bacterium]|nr:ABC transporter permease [Clostridia bacterium]
MALGNSIKMAFKSLWSSKMRTFLTMLGVIIGVTTVALLTTVTNGATQTIMNSLGAESRLVTMLTQNAENPFTLEKLGSLIENINSQESTGDYTVTAVAQNDVAVDKASHVVEVHATIGGRESTYTMRVGATVRGVDDKFLDVRNIEVDGEFVSADGECIVDREFVKAYLESKSNDEVIGTTVYLGGKLDFYTYSFSSSVEADIQEFYTALTQMCMMYQVDIPAVPTLGENLFVDGGVFTYVEDIAPVEYYDCPSLEVQVRESLDARTYEFASDYEVEITETFVGGRDYEIVGVIEEEDSSLMGSGSSAGGLSGLGSGTLSALAEYSKTKQGNVYVTLTDANADLFGNFASVDSVPLNGAYFLFEDESAIDDSVLNISMSMINMGYKIFEDCYIIPMNTVTQIMGLTMDIMTILFTVIAAISLVVGGIGIMNIMLVAVSERTREIGIRKAIGAKRSSILLQFLIEALVVSLVGGLLGLLTSFVGSLIIGSVMGISLSMPLWVILMSLGFCLVIGVAFGMYPAIKASRLQPIDALHRD